MVSFVILLLLLICTSLIITAYDALIKKSKKDIVVKMYFIKKLNFRLYT